MKKSILKSLEPKTKSLFRFKNSDSKPNFFGATTNDTGTTSSNTDATTTTSSAVTW